VEDLAGLYQILMRVIIDLILLNMSTMSHTDTFIALGPSAQTKGYKIVPMGQNSIVSVGSLE
jgi:hypothetical protein